MQCEISSSWNKYLEKFPPEKKDIYFTEEYVNLYKDSEHTPECIVASEGANILLMPYLRAEVGDLHDFETAYGYGGPIANTEHHDFIRKALDEIARFLCEKNYVCGFTRFHPLLKNAEYCKDAMDVLFDRHTVTIDTGISEDDIWSTMIKSKNRNMIRKAEKNGLVYKAEEDFASLPEFVELYNATMKRLDADSFYFFGDDYYRVYVKALAGRGFLGTVRLDGKLICGALFMYSEDFGHYHLEGSDHQYSSLGANNFLLWNTACEMHRRGVKQFHLGGGYNSDEENSLFKFKKAFSPILTDFYIGKQIFNKEAYDDIKADWVKKNPEKEEVYGNRLLCYRY